MDVRWLLFEQFELKEHKILLAKGLYLPHVVAFFQEITTQYITKLVRLNVLIVSVDCQCCSWSPAFSGWQFKLHSPMIFESLHYFEIDI